MSITRYRDLLGVQQDATREEITAAYRRAAMRSHPDRNPDDDAAKEKFQEIGQAYRFLLQLTPQSRWGTETTVTGADVNADVTDSGESDEEVVARTQAEVEAAVAAWRAARDEELKRRMEYEVQRIIAQQREKQQLEQQWRLKTPFSVALPATLLAGIAGLSWEAPLNVLIVSALLLVAFLACPKQHKTYTAMALTTVIRLSVKLFFLGLLLYLLLRGWQQIRI